MALPIITVFSRKGGVAKTRINMLIAWVLAVVYGKRIMYIEADPSNATGSKWINNIQKSKFEAADFDYELPFSFRDINLPEEKVEMKKSDGFGGYLRKKVLEYRETNGCLPDAIIMDIGSSVDLYRTIAKGSYTIIPTSESNDDLIEALNTGQISTQLEAKSVVYLMSLVTPKRRLTSQRHSLAGLSRLPVLGAMAEKLSNTRANIYGNEPDQDTITWFQPILKNILVTTGLGEQLDIEITDRFIDTICDADGNTVDAETFTESK